MVSSTSSAARNAASWSSSIAPRTACSASPSQGAVRPPKTSGVEELAGDTDVIPGGLLPVGVPQQGRGVVRGDHRDPGVAVHLAAELAERLLRLHQRGDGGAAGGEDHLRLEDRQLTVEIRETRLQFVWERLPVLRRPALHGVEDED